MPETADFVGVEQRAVPEWFAYTIAEVALGDDFPAEGHSDRVHAWAETSLDAWCRSVPSSDYR